MLHLVCECQPLQTQHFFIFLFASFGMWLLIRLFANLRYSYSINSSLVHSFWYFWLATLAFKCQLASSARRAARSALPGAGPTVLHALNKAQNLCPCPKLRSRRGRPGQLPGAPSCRSKVSLSSACRNTYFTTARSESTRLQTKNQSKLTWIKVPTSKNSEKN